MHIHHSQMAPQTAGAHVGAANAAASAQRAAETRRKLLGAASRTDGAQGDGESFMIARWSEEGSGQRERRNPPSKARPEEPESESAPISVWA